MTEHYNRVAAGFNDEPLEPYTFGDGDVAINVEGQEDWCNECEKGVLVEALSAHYLHGRCETWSTTRFCPEGHLLGVPIHEQREFRDDPSWESAHGFDDVEPPSFDDGYED